MTCSASSPDATGPIPTMPARGRCSRPLMFRKVTNGFRAEWGAKVYAAAASVIATGRLYAMTALAALSAALAGKTIIQAA